MYARLISFYLVKCIFFAAFFLPGSASSFALDRPLPEDALPGKLSMSYRTPLVIDGKPYQLTAGAQIRDQHNRIVQPKTLTLSDAPVLYQANAQGQIHRIWILTKEEAVQIPARPAVIPGRRPRPSTGFRNPPPVTPEK